jgi:hypothetical protein
MIDCSDYDEWGALVKDDCLFSSASVSGGGGARGGHQGSGDTITTIDSLHQIIGNGDDLMMSQSALPISTGMSGSNVMISGCDVQVGRFFFRL